MRKISLLFVLLLSVSFIFSQENDEIHLKLKGVRVENDYHKKITWIKSIPIPLVSKDFTVSTYDVSHIQLYFGLYMEDSIQKITPIRIVNTYKNSDWVFFDEISYLIGDRRDVRAGKGVVFTLKDDKTNTKVEKGVSERSDIPASNKMLEFITYIADNPVVQMECRYINNRDSQSYTLKVNKGTKKLKKHFNAFLDAYNQVTESFNLDNQLKK